MIDLLRIRTDVWPELSSTSSERIIEECVPTVRNIDVNDVSSEIARVAVEARKDLVAALAEVGDELMEEYFFGFDEDGEGDDDGVGSIAMGPTDAELVQSMRDATVSRKILPVLAGAALRGKGVEPLLDAVVDLLPSPMDRLPPALIRLDDGVWDRSTSGGGGRRRGGKKKKKGGAKQTVTPDTSSSSSSSDGTDDEKTRIELGHPLHPSLLAFAFKVVHMKGRGGSGDGRVVFARVYSGSVSSRDTLMVITPRNEYHDENSGGDGGSATLLPPDKPRTERVGGMLELAGGSFTNRPDVICHSGDVCALIGLRSVVTGDTLLLAPSGNNHHQHNQQNHNGGNGSGIWTDTDGYEYVHEGGNVYLAGVSSPKPVLSVRIEAETSEQQAKLAKALDLMVTEDPSLHVEETGSATILSGLGELHIEVVVDRIRRETGLSVWIGKPAVTYHETVVTKIETNGLKEYDRTVGNTRLQGAVHLSLEPMYHGDTSSSSCLQPIDPVVTIGAAVRKYLGFPTTIDPSSSDYISEDELCLRSEVARALVSGCIGALKRGSIGASNTITNVHCNVVDIDAEGGLNVMNALPGSMRAAASSAVSALMAENQEACRLLEPTMNVEVMVPGEMVGTVLSDLSVRRGLVGEVVMGDDSDGNGGDGNRDRNAVHAKALVRGEVPLAEILGYANSLRSITGGEGTFTAEYKGHSHCDIIDN